MSRYSFITAYIADPEQQAHPQASPSAAAAANRGPQSADIPSDQQGHRRAQHTQQNINRQTDRTTGASGAEQPMQHRQIKLPNMSKSRGTATYTPESAKSWQHSQPEDTAKIITPPSEHLREPHWWGHIPNIADAHPSERLFMLDAVQAAVGELRITGTDMTAFLLNWDGESIMLSGSSAPPTDAASRMTRISLNAAGTVLTIPPKSLTLLRSLKLIGRNLQLTNPDMRITRDLGKWTLILSEDGYVTCAIALLSEYQHHK
ncbi:hypothetical protein [Rothia mucilaginosa]|uniref:hypothetical protein n=1 Tax=Rothia mucilaginosa TaxID=43675 RepID=UPI0028D50B85|nr:hypothetical protein [Rothia mucilaginosa]